MRPTESPPEPGPSTLGRRGLLAAGAGAAIAAVSGCSLNNPFDPAKTPAAEATPGLAPDVALAVTAVELLLRAEAGAKAAVAAHPGLAPTLGGLVTVHRTHVDALIAAVPAGVDVKPQTAAAQASRPRAALRAQQAIETDLRNQLVALAVRARSGPFARLLGTMAAGTSQRIAELPR
jgi:hypothetical protein